MKKHTTPVLPQPIFNEGNVSPDPTRFKTAHPSDKLQYKEIEKLLKTQVVGFDPSRLAPDEVFGLESAFGAHGPEITKRIKNAGKIIFHAAGDTGASNEGKYGNEISVADQVTSDCRTSNTANRAAFFYHLGDIVYNFGESKYYYDQFYDPFRNYPGPIFAIPGNHDSFVIPETPAEDAPLKIFARNFCASEPSITPEAGSLHRTSMTQPGVSLEDPGVISSEKGKWANVADTQLDYLAAQLARIKNENFSGAVLLAVHHPPFSYAPPPGGRGSGGNHGGSPNMLRQIDAICKAQGVYPHAVLSGHAHNYQRFTRTLTFGNIDITVPFIICGDGGHNVNKLVKSKLGQLAREPYFGVNVDYLESKPAVKAKSLVLKHYDDTNYGYLRITVDKTYLRIGFQQVGQTTIPQSRMDMVTVELASRTIVAN